MSEVRFTVYGVAQPAGSKRAFLNRKTGRVVVTDDAKHSRPWKSEVSAAAIEATGSAELLDGPLSLSVRFVVPRPKSHFGVRGLRPSAPAWPAKKPDATKLLRGVEDALNRIVWRDDAQVVVQRVEKVYGEPARCEVVVSTLDGEGAA